MVSMCSAVPWRGHGGGEMAIDHYPCTINGANRSRWKRMARQSHWREVLDGGAVIVASGAGRGR
jgi:hypothetical protein